MPTWFCQRPPGMIQRTRDLLVDDGRATEPFCGRTIGNRKRQISQGDRGVRREAFRQADGVRRNLIYSPRSPRAPCKKKNLDRSSHGAACSAPGRCGRTQWRPEPALLRWHGFFRQRILQSGICTVRTVMALVQKALERLRVEAFRKGIVVTPANFNGVDWPAEMSGCRGRSCACRTLSCMKGGTR
jgi:hypothetical protein